MVGQYFLGKKFAKKGDPLVDGPNNIPFLIRRIIFHPNLKWKEYPKEMLVYGNANEKYGLVIYA